MDNPLTDFDSLTFTHPLQMLKAALPYMETPNQKNFTILIKFFELQNALSLIQSENSQLSACCDESNENRMINMLSAIRGFCSEKDQEFIDLFINFNMAMQIQ